MKTNKKLLASAMALGLAALSTVGSTFAWFSMNTTVSATGMSLQATTPVNLLIADETTGTFANSATANESWGTAKLFPATSNDGVKFNAIKNSGNYINSGAGGVAEASTVFQPTSAVTTVAENTDGYWAEYDFAVKLSQAQTTPSNVYLSALNIYEVVKGDGSACPTADTYYTLDAGVYTAVAKDATLTADATYYKVGGITGAVRVALIVAADAAITPVAHTFIYSLTGESTANVVKATLATEKAYSAIDGEDKVTVNTYAPNTDTCLFAVNDTAISYKIVVWIEGQDSDCTNAVAGHAFSVDYSLAVKSA